MVKNVNSPKTGEKLMCPVCNKQFVVSADTKFITNGGYTCSKACFISHTTKIYKEKLKKEQESKNT